MFSVHWFAITIFQDVEKVKAIWAQFFALGLGVLIEKGHGGRRYKQILEALQGAKIYFDYGDEKTKVQHCHIEIPGSACEALTPSTFQDLVNYLKQNEVRFNIKRADFAFDGVPFTPQNFYDGLLSDNLVSLIKRDPSLNNESIRIEQSPCKLRENGEVGTTTVYAGSKSSDRMVRVYDKRGDVRLEFQMRDERAHAVCLDVFTHAWAEWENTVKAHVRQFIDFKNTNWWDVFIATSHKADLKISSARRIALSKMENWFERQVVVSLSVYEDIFGKAEARERLNGFITKARKTRDRSRYASVLQLAQ
jgi:DNA relaxase NicK